MGETWTCLKAIVRQGKGLHLTYGHIQPFSVFLVLWMATVREEACKSLEDKYTYLSIRY